MLPADIKHVREKLGCSIGELGDAVGVDAKTILRWEAGELFPTKRHADRLKAVAEAGPAAIPRRSRGKKGSTGLDLLAEPRLWSVMRKLLAHPELMTAVEKLAEKYDDPTPSR